MNFSSSQNRNLLLTNLKLHIIFQSGGSSAILMDLASNEKHVHADFYNDFDDLFDDGDDDILNVTSDNNA